MIWKHSKAFTAVNDMCVINLCDTDMTYAVYTEQPNMFLVIIDTTEWNLFSSVSL